MPAGHEITFTKEVLRAGNVEGFTAVKIRR